MLKKKLKIIFFLIILIFFIIWIYLKFNSYSHNKVKIDLNLEKENEKLINKSNVIKNVTYSAKDKNRNEYTITAEEGEIDQSNKDLIYLKNIKSFIRLIKSDEIFINSKFGKYNVLTYDTIFYDNVFIQYGEIKIFGDYLEFSIKNNIMEISKNVIMFNASNILKADGIKMNIQTKDVKIYMNEKNKKVNIKSKKKNGIN